MLNYLKAVLLIGLLIISGSTLAQEGKKSLTIGMNNWAENIAVANMWKILLEEQGYEVKLILADKAPIWAGVATGDIQLTLEAWLPAADGAYFDRFKDQVERIGPWFKDAQLGLVVPEYVDISSIDQLNEQKDKFEVRGTATIYGIDPGSSLMALTQEAVEQYGLDYRLLSSSEPGMLLSLEKAYKNNQPVVVTLWDPHWVWAKYQLKFLEDPKGAYGEPDSIYGIATKGFAEEYPEVAGWLNQWQMDSESLGGLMNQIREGGEKNPEEGAKAWIEEHRDLVNQWFE